MKEKLRILIVDDEPGYRVSLADCLELEGYETRCVANAREALETASVFAPDLLIADWMLGGTQSGLDVAESLKSVLPGLRSILITGYLDIGLEGKAGGVVERILSKPFGLDELIETVTNVLDESREGRVAL